MANVSTGLSIPFSWRGPDSIVMAELWSAAVWVAASSKTSPDRAASQSLAARSVSYTHLTLPTKA